MWGGIGAGRMTRTGLAEAEGERTFMGAFVALMAGLGAAAAWCAVVLVRRGRRGATDNADGLLIEQAARLRAQRMRSDARAFRDHPHGDPGSGPGQRRH
ncbi:hypothetical protein YW3DRAFT_02197 [Streptomyces sp. MnatMP-M77]|nr:hypothetical protein YW3DRAFT_02197 [Streptomyces sp. MnatMP-M77]